MLYGMANNNVIIPAERDGALYNFLLGNQDYVFEGIGNEFAITPSSSSFVLTLGTGEGVVCGRHVTEDGTNPSILQLTPSTSGYVVIRVDLAQVAGSEAYLFATPSMTQENLNGGGTVHDLPLYQYTTNASGVSSFTDVRNLSAGSNVVCELSGGQLYVMHYEDGTITRKQVGSLDPATLTATPADVKAGMIFGGANSDEPMTGTFGGQSKTVSPSGFAAQTVYPDAGNYLQSVTVNAITGNFRQLTYQGSSDGSARSWTTSQAYTGIIVCWNNSVNVTTSGNAPAWESGRLSPTAINDNIRVFLGVPAGCTFTHPAYNASTGNCTMTIYQILG